MTKNMTQSCQYGSFVGANAELYYYLCRMKMAEWSRRDDGAMIDTFAFMRFPLMVCVLLCHSFISGAMGDADVACFAKSSFVLSKIVARVAVPNFLFISGYLFFRNVESFSTRIYCDKLKRRLRSIVLPYLLWNAVVILLYFVGQSLVPQLFSGEHTRVCDYTFVEWLQAFWRVEGTESPINPPLWYMRNLMVMIVLSPLIYWLLKNRVVGAVFIATMLCLWLSCLPVNRMLVWLNPKVTFFFSLGAWFALHRVEMPRFRCWVAVLGVLLYVGTIAGVLVGRGLARYISYETAILLGAVLTMYLAHYLAGNRGWRVPKGLSDSYFFIYLFHYIPQALIIKLLLRVVGPTTNAEYFAIYFGSFAAMLVIGILLFRILQRLLPKTTAFVLGNRV